MKRPPRNKSLSQKEFLLRCQQMHGDRYSYKKSIFEKTTKKVVITCQDHGDFLQVARLHYGGSGCPYCYKMKRLNIDNFYSDAKILYGNQYDYSKTDLNLFIKKKIKKIIIICKDHGEFLCKPNDHLNLTLGSGCRNCGYENVKLANKKRTMTTKDFIKKARKVHGTKYIYSDTKYVSQNILVDIICSIHGNFKQKPHNHLNGNGCQSCAVFSTSLMEQKWLNKLNIPENQRQKWLNINGKRIKVDAFIKETNTVYEFFGDYWHGNPNNSRYGSDDLHPQSKKTYKELYEMTMKRIDLLEQNGYNVIYKWEMEWLNENHI